MISNSSAGHLGLVLDRAEFGEWHHGVIDAPVERVWAALRQLRWVDLRLGRVLLLVRGLGGRLDQPWWATFAALGPRIEDEPTEMGFAIVGRPWSLRPQSHVLGDLDAVHAFTRPGWLKYGMTWRLTALPDGRTLVETITLCQPTDAAARRRFRAYWLLIRPGSALIRREMIAALVSSVESLGKPRRSSP